MKRAIIIGATSGIGKEVARLLLQQGWYIGIAGRRTEALEALQTDSPKQVEIQRMDVTAEDAPMQLQRLIEKLGGMDLFFLSSGVGFQNRDLNPEIELNTAYTNVDGFIRMMTCAFHYFRKKDADISPSSVPLQVPKVWELLPPTLPPNVFRTLT